MGILPESVTVLLPAYNEEQSIGKTIAKIKALHPEFEVLVVDDGSTDQTLQVAMAAGATVWPHPDNLGNGAAIKSGLRCARGEWIVMMDADGQHDPDDIARLLAHADRYEMVIGARVSGSETHWHRNLANGIYNRLASYVTRFKIADLTSGFRLVRAQTARQFINILPNTFSYPTTLTMTYLHSGRAIRYVPIQTRARQGKSKIKLLRDGTRFLLIITKVATLFAPMRLFFPMSAGLFSLGLLYYLYTYSTQGRFTNMSALLFNTSIIIFFMGLISEQISQLRQDQVDE